VPLYDYDCAACGRRFETIHGVFADPPGTCPLCGAGPVRKAIAAPTIHFKGSGWAKKERHAASGRSSPKSGEDGSRDSTDAEPAAAKDTSGPGAKDASGPGTKDGTSGPATLPSPPAAGSKPPSGSEPTTAAAAD
jgi:putative FmdB family regulatory protein